MSSLIQELENNEALLLMYVADELPAEDKLEVEQMLASDGSLRMELEEIRSAMASSLHGLSTLDELEPISASTEAIALRSTSRMMKQWHVDRLRMQPEPTAKKPRYPAWVVPTAAAASILLGVVGWWGITSDARLPTMDGQKIAENTTEAPAVEPVDEHARLLVDSLSNEPTDLVDAENQAKTLVSRTEDPTSSLLLDELSN